MANLTLRVRAERIAELRVLAASTLAETYDPDAYYGGRGPGAWSVGVDGALGGPAGAYCAAVHPDLLVVLLDELERLRKVAASGVPESVVSESLEVDA